MFKLNNMLCSVPFCTCCFCSLKLFFHFYDHLMFSCHLWVSSTLIIFSSTSHLSFFISLIYIVSVFLLLTIFSAFLFLFCNYNMQFLYFPHTKYVLLTLLPCEKTLLMNANYIISSK